MAEHGGHRRLVISRVKYRVLDDKNEPTIETALMSAETFLRSLAAPSLLAHIITTVIAAARKEALATAFCLSTDATGVAVQPIPTGNKKRQPCRHAHFFVQIADVFLSLFLGLAILQILMIGSATAGIDKCGNCPP